MPPQAASRSRTPGSDIHHIYVGEMYTFHIGHDGNSVYHYNACREINGRSADALVSDCAVFSFYPLSNCVLLLFHPLSSLLPLRFCRLAVWSASLPPYCVCAGIFKRAPSRTGQHVFLLSFRLITAGLPSSTVVTMHSIPELVTYQGSSISFWKLIPFAPVK